MQAKKRALTRDQILDLGFLSLQNYEKIKVYCLLPSLWYFVMAAKQTSTEKNQELYLHTIADIDSHMNTDYCFTRRK